MRMRARTCTHGIAAQLQEITCATQTIDTHVRAQEAVVCRRASPVLMHFPGRKHQARVIHKSEAKRDGIRPCEELFRGSWPADTRSQGWFVPTLCASRCPVNMAMRSDIVCACLCVWVLVLEMYKPGDLQRGACLTRMTSH